MLMHFVCYSSPFSTSVHAFHPFSVLNSTILSSAKAVAPAKSVTALKTSALWNFPLPTFKIAPAIGLPMRSPKPANVKLIPMRVPIKPILGEMRAMIVGGNDTMAPEN